MKMIDIMRATSPNEHRAIKRWFWYTCILICLVLLIGLIMYGKLFLAYRTALAQQKQLQPRVQQLHDTLTRKRALKEQTQQLSRQLVKMNRIGNQPKSPYHLLTAVAQTLPNSMSLHTVSLKRKKLDMSVNASNTQAVLAFTQKLKEHTLVGDITLQEIEPYEQNQVRATMQGQLT